jgi:hypothetical protein
MALDSQTVRDGDMGFVGYASRPNPLTLAAGMLQESVNMRIDRGVASTRKGAKRLAEDISVSGTPLTVPFDLAAVTGVGDPVVLASYSGGIFASEVMLLPEDNAALEAVVLAGPDRAFTYVTDNALGSNAAGTAGVLAVSDTDNLVTDTGDEIYVVVLPAEITYPTSPDEIIEPTDKVSMLQAYNRLYLFREADRSQTGWGTKYTNSSGISVAGTTATVNVPQHGFPVNARVRIEGGSSAALDGHEYNVIAVIDANSFTVEVPSGTPTEATANIAVRRVKPPLYWTGDPTADFVRAPAGVPAEGPTYRRLRSVPWASYINNRLIVPDGRQNVQISDVLDPDIYDPFWQSFRAGLGGNDRIMAVHPWVEGSALVFCRKSIWLATINQFASTDGSDFAINTPISKLELLTDEIGCAARRTIVTAGQFIYFLSDSGVYRLDARLDLKLRGETKPLSDPIGDRLATLNTNLVEDSVAIYQNNRFYLAAPLADATDSNNGVFIYNQILEQWETQDLYGFGVNNFIVSNVAGERRVMISNRAGFLMLLDQIEEGDQSPSSDVDVTTPVTGRIRTRRYDLGTMHSKRFVRCLSDVLLADGSTLTMKAHTLNPDNEITLVPSQSNNSGEDETYTLKSPIRAKAHYCELEFITGAKRPEIRNAAIEGVVPNFPQTETRNAA